jgi:hypothetical protein
MTVLTSHSGGSTILDADGILSITLAPMIASSWPSLGCIFMPPSTGEQHGQGQKHFPTTSGIVESPAGNQPTLQIPALLSRGRDAFRGVLSEENPRMFQRHGPVDACLIDIFASLSHGETSSKYYSSITSCGGPRCNIKCITPAGAPYMLTPKAWDSITRSGNSPGGTVV